MLKSRSQEFAPLCHLPDVIAINFISVHTASNICYHSSTAGQTDLFFAHSGVNHTESHLLNTSADFPPDILLYWHLNWKPVVKTCQEILGNIRKSRNNSFPWKQWRSRAFYYKEKDLRCPDSIHHQEFWRSFTTAITWDSIPYLVRHPAWLVSMMEACSYHRGDGGYIYTRLLSGKSAGKHHITPMWCTTPSRRDAQCCLGREWEASLLQLDSERAVLWTLTVLFMRTILSFLIQK